MRAAILRFLLALLIVAGSAHAEQAPFVIAPPPLPGDEYAWATDVSADGQRVVGVSQHTGRVCVLSACNAIVLWDGFGPALKIASSFSSYPSARISADGSTIVGSVATSPGVTQGFRWNAIDGLVYFPTDAPLEPWFGPADVAADGSVIYGSGTACDPPSCGHPAARWEAGVVSIFTPTGYPDETSVGSIGAELIGAASGGRVVGYGWAPWPIAFVSDGITAEPLFTPVDDPSSCRPVRVAGDGSAVVGSCGRGVDEVPVRWSLEDPLGFAEFQVQGRALDISDGGRVVVGTMQDQAFVRDEATGVRAVADVLQASGVDPTGVALDEALGVSADGRTVVGRYFIARLPESVPESDALACGLAALVALRCLARAS
jgi:hypothetical protein